MRTTHEIQKLLALDPIPLKRRMKHVYHDGGREAAGFNGRTTDCVIRAAALATDYDYHLVYKLVEKFNATERMTRRR